MSNHPLLIYLQPIVQTFFSVVVFALLLEWAKGRLQQKREKAAAKENLTVEVAIKEQTIAAELPHTVWAWLRNEHEDNLRLRANELALTERAINAEAMVKALQFKLDVEMHQNLELTREKMELEVEKTALEKRIEELEAKLIKIGKEEHD